MNLKCYISSNFNSDLFGIKNILSNLNVDTDNFYEFSVGSSFSDLIKKKIKESDFVLALINEKNDNVFFEIGIAEAAGKPLFIVIQPDKKIPIFLEDKMYFKLDWSKNSDLLELSLKNYMQDIGNNSHRTNQKRKIKELPILSVNETNSKLANLRELRARDFKEVDIIEIIMDVFKKINIQAVSQMKLNDKTRVDIAITNESLSSYFGNPLLIEVKCGVISKNTIEIAQNQLQNFINKSSANFGILLYFDSNNQRFNLIRRSNILMFDLEDFIEGISTFGFEKFLINSRNEFVHGIDSNKIN